MAALGNGGLRVATVVLTGLVLLLFGALARGTTHITRLDAQLMVDREVGHINVSIGLLREDIAALHALVQDGG